MTVLMHSTSLQREPVHDPFRVPHYLWLCAAIESFTSAAVARDPRIFEVRGADLRYIVERHLFFALINDQRLYRHFVASERRIPDDEIEPLSEMASLLTPFLRRDAPRLPKARKSIRTRFLRRIYRRCGRGNIRCAGFSAPPSVLFHVIHPKFVRYFRPIVEALRSPAAFLAIDDPHMYQWLEAENLPRVGIELTPASYELTRRPAKLGPYEYLAEPFDFLAIRCTVGPFEYLAEPFDFLAIKFNAVRDALRSLRPDCIVVAEGNAPNCELVNRAARTLSIPVACIQQGWAPVVHNGFRNMSYSAFCVWGQGFADLLAPHNPGQRFVITGSHAVNCRQEDDADRRAVGFFLQKGAHLMTERAWTCMLELIAWAATSFPGIEIRVREHPSAPLTAGELAMFDGLSNIRLFSPDRASLRETLSGCRVVVAMDSTTILEGAACGAVPLVLSVNGFDHYSPNIAAEGGAVDVQEFAAARSSLSRLLQDDAYWRSFGPALERVREHFFACDGDRALAAIVAEIERLRCRAGKAGAAARARWLGASLG